MAVEIKVKFDADAFRKTLRKNAEQWPEAADYTMRTMRRRAPVIVARNTAQVYNVPQYRLNPNNKNGRGSLSLSGGIATFTMTYRGMRLPITDFKGLKPKSISKARKRPYTVTGQIVKGQTSQVGHWNLPGSEGGRYSANSPWMVVPGVPGPVMRIGGTLGGTMRALSVPQMVVSMRHDEQTIDELQTKMFEELQRQLARFGVS